MPVFVHCSHNLMLLLNRVPVAVELICGCNASQHFSARNGKQLAVVLELVNAILYAQHLDLRSLLVVVIGDAKKYRENLKFVVDSLD